MGAARFPTQRMFGVARVLLESADRSHDQDRCPESREVLSRGRTEESREPRQVMGVDHVAYDGRGSALPFCIGAGPVARNSLAVNLRA
jgi:hypothetical protein